MAVVVESFEDIIVGPNATLFYPGAIRIGTTSPFVFVSGVTLTEPFPNNSGGALFVGDMDQGWGGSSGITAGDIPTGAAVLAANYHNPVFTFAEPVQTVSIKVFTEDYTAGLIAYDALDRVIAVATTPKTTAGGWATSTLKITTKAPIDHVQVIGGDFYLDDLAFDSAKPNILKASRKNDKLKGEVADEFADGKGGNDKIDGKGGDDTLFGGTGKDKLKGGDGNDSLTGGEDKDTVSGGAGRDTFMFGTLDAVDKVKDFSPSEDTMILPVTTFAALKPGIFLDGSQLVIGAAAVDADDRVIYDFNTGGLFYDIDGIGATAPIQFAQLKPGLPLDNEDFLLI